MEVSRRIEVSPFAMFMDDKLMLATKRTITSYSDIRQTAIGPVDFGWVHIGPATSATEEEWRAVHNEKAPPAHSRTSGASNRVQGGADAGSVIREQGSSGASHHFVVEPNLM